jgi:hypothetical protein
MQRRQRLSHLGSGMGAEGFCQPRSGAVTGTDRRWLTWENVPEQQAANLACSVRIEGVRGSNPLSSTWSEARREPLVGPRDSG